MAKLRSTTDFFAGDGFCVELARVGQNSTLGLVLYKNGEGASYGKIVTLPDYVLVPPEEDEITRHIRFAETVGDVLEVRRLLTRVDDFLSLCIELDDRRRFLLACFVLSSWVVDWLPVAPYIAFVGLPGSGKSTALRALYLVCRRGLITYDISSAAFYRACDRLARTLCIDEAASAGEKRVLFHLLRAGTTRDAAAFRVGQSYRAYGAKAVSWNEMPDDEALNSRCIIIPMKESSCTSLLRTTDPAVMAEADRLQALLLGYRLHHCGKPFSRELSGHARLRSRDRDLYEALALPLYGESKLCACLLECIEYQQNVNQEPLPPKQIAVLEGLFKTVHIQPDREDYALGQLKNEANLRLASLGERFHLNERTVSEILKTFGFVDRKRTRSGWVVLVDSAARKRLHELLWFYGVSLSACLPTDLPTEVCEFCKVQDTRQENGQGNEAKNASFDKKRWAFTVEEAAEEQASYEKAQQQEAFDERAEMVADWQHSVLDPSMFEQQPDSGENGTGASDDPFLQGQAESIQSPDSPITKRAEPSSAQEVAAEMPAESDQTAESRSNRREHNEHDAHENGPGLDSLVAPTQSLQSSGAGKQLPSSKDGASVERAEPDQQSDSISRENGEGHEHPRVSNDEVE